MIMFRAIKSVECIKHNIRGVVTHLLFIILYPMYYYWDILCGDNFR